MTVQRSHGRPYPLVAALDELPGGVPGDARGHADAHEQLKPLAPPPYAAGSPEARDAARRAALIRWEREREEERIKRYLGRVNLPDGHPVRPYREDAGTFAKEHTAALAATVGGGLCGPGPSVIVTTASLQLAASRWLFDMAAEQQSPKLAMMASKLGDSSRQNLLAAHELCAREATAHLEAKRGVDIAAELRAYDDSAEGR